MIQPPDISLGAIESAMERLIPHIVATPILPFESPQKDTILYLKPENLQPIGSFKIRGAGNAMMLLEEEKLKSGVYTSSAGNMAQGLAWWARKMGVSCKVLVPDHAPFTKLDAIKRLGAEYIKLPFAEWWQSIANHGHPDFDGTFIHPVSHPDVIAGNGTIGLEILKTVPDVDAVIVPFGGGGLSCGIATAVKSLKPGVKVWASEVATASPLSAALSYGSPVEIEYHPSYVDGIGSSKILAEMWPLANSLLDGSIVVSLDETAEAICQLFRHSRIVAEGAGATSLAAALSGKIGKGKIVCVVSGGNIDESVLLSILENKM